LPPCSQRPCARAQPVTPTAPAQYAITHQIANLTSAIVVSVWFSERFTEPIIVRFSVSFTVDLTVILTAIL
jgi:hypothetical protein